MTVRAVCFDLWSTLVAERPPGLLEPRVAVWGELLANHAVNPDALHAAHRSALHAYQAAWRRNEPFCSDEAAAWVLSELQLDINGALRGALVLSFNKAGMRSRIAAEPNAVTVLSAIHDTGVATAVICDIGLTPSSALVEHLRRLGLAPHLDVLTWSDKLGRYKPDPLPFRRTLELLAVEPTSAVHVGDRLRTDVGGARAVGMAPVSYRGAYDDPDDLPDADAVVDDLLDVLDIVGVERP